MIQPGVPRAILEDDVYERYVFPNDSIVCVINSKVTAFVVSSHCSSDHHRRFLHEPEISKTRQWRPCGGTEGLNEYRSRQASGARSKHAVYYIQYNTHGCAFLNKR